RAAARRIAEERGEEVGRSVGYHIRFERRVSQDTQILVVTEGVLLRMLQSDPFLEDVGAVVFDEFHERRLDSDLALAMVRVLQSDARPDLLLVVMSATLDAEPIATFLGKCPIVTSQGRQFPVDVEYLEHRDERPIEVQAASAVARVLDDSPGDVLVFLPGVREIRRTEERLQERVGQRLGALLGKSILPLYGELTSEQQDKVLRPSADQKIILATNVAETSVTIPGVRTVIDSGLVRRLRFDTGTGLDVLELGRISRASAEQRRGRAGRTGPGRCLRLWTRGQQGELSEREVPEVLRLDFAPPALQLLAWGEPNPAEFPWFEPPRASAVEEASRLLELLGATKKGAITELGRRLAELPLHPRLARLLLESARLDVLSEAALSAALLSDRDPFRGGPNSAPSRIVGCDLLERVRAIQAWQAGGRTQRLHYGELKRGAARAVIKTAQQLEHTVRREPVERGSGASMPLDARH
ncbi:MAG: ATP-dependent RNA helicase, partial [Myxococcales bacterium]|nr:ATP-dependent RNA helicase [Myxococcales bacterium]